MKNLRPMTPAQDRIRAARIRAQDRTDRLILIEDGEKLILSTAGELAARADRARAAVRTAREIHDERLARAKKQVELLDSILDAVGDFEPNFAHVGDMTMVNDSLDTLLRFLLGLEDDEDPLA